MEANTTICGVLELDLIPFVMMVSECECVFKRAASDLVERVVFGSALVENT